jgi:hypothetical protein
VGVEVLVKVLLGVTELDGVTLFVGVLDGV